MYEKQCLLIYSFFNVNYKQSRHDIAYVVYSSETANLDCLGCGIKT